MINVSSPEIEMRRNIARPSLPRQELAKKVETTDLRKINRDPDFYKRTKLENSKKYEGNTIVETRAQHIMNHSLDLQKKFKTTHFPDLLQKLADIADNKNIAEVRSYKMRATGNYMMMDRKSGVYVVVKKDLKEGDVDLPESLPYIVTAYASDFDKQEQWEQQFDDRCTSDINDYLNRRI